MQEEAVQRLGEELEGQRSGGQALAERLEGLEAERQALEAKVQSLSEENDALRTGGHGRGASSPTSAGCTHLDILNRHNNDDCLPF